MQASAQRGGAAFCRIGARGPSEYTRTPCPAIRPYSPPSRAPLTIPSVNGSSNAPPVGNRRDIAQESFARLAAVDDLAAIDDPRAFLYRVADNLAADAYDHQQVRARYSEPAIDPDTLPSPSPGPEAAADCHRRLERVGRALSQLPDLYRFAFLLNRIEGLTYAEVAGRLGISEKTVERYIKKALAVCTVAVED